MNISLRAGDKMYLNGAVIKVDRKVSIELLNKVTFLLGTHVLQANEAVTPLRQIYFAIQTLLMDPTAKTGATSLARKMIMDAIETFESVEEKSILPELKRIDELASCGQNYEAMKALRGLFDLERRIMFPDETPATVNAA